MKQVEEDCPSILDLMKVSQLSKLPECNACETEVPANSSSLLFVYKNAFSIVLLALVGTQCQFLNVDVGSYGKTVMGVFSAIHLWETLGT